jgi:hypothetical protein
MLSLQSIIKRVSKRLLPWGEITTKSGARRVAKIALI